MNEANNSVILTLSVFNKLWFYFALNRLPTKGFVISSLSGIPLLIQLLLRPERTNTTMTRKWNQN